LVVSGNNIPGKEVGKSPLVSLLFALFVWNLMLMRNG
jgi:hypothetical protein